MLETRQQFEPTADAAGRVAARQPPRELLTAWLLLLLGREATHGYELRRRLEANGIVTDPAAMYRLLRKLETEGRAESFWGECVAGPRRRLYRLTPKGLRDLDALVRAIRNTCDTHAAFLQAHEARLRREDQRCDNASHAMTCECALQETG
jgi:PadR family transcriptional regulator, regulatory protein PadR